MADVRPVFGLSEESNALGWLAKIPLVSLLLVVAFAAAPFVLGPGTGASESRFVDAQEEARTYFARNPRLAVEPVGELLLGTEWLAETRLEAAENEAEYGSGFDLSPRLLERSQARLDQLVDAAYLARMEADPAWRLGVQVRETPPRNYFAHAFVQETVAALMVGILVLLVVGAPLERAFGRLAFGGLVLGAIPLAAQAYRVFDAGLRVPWSGASGLAGALVGAYFIRGLGGRFVVPGWLVLPAWLGAELFFLRRLGIEPSVSVPWATLSASVAFGAGVAAVFRLLRVEAHREARRTAKRNQGPHPVIARAARLQSDGDPHQAFDLLHAAWREERGDADLREAFYLTAVDVGRPEAAAEAIVPNLRQSLRKREFDRAKDLWLPLAERECAVALEPTAFVRLAELVLDAGQVEAALFSLRCAVDAGISSAGAVRVVNVARDLDVDLTRRAAAIAAADPGLDASIRAEIEPMLTPAPDVSAAVPEAAAAPERDESAESEVYTRAALSLEPESDPREPLEPGTPGAVDSFETEDALEAQALDFGAVDAGVLAGEVADDSLLLDSPEAMPLAEEDETVVSLGVSRDVLSHLGEPASMASDDTLEAFVGALDEGDLLDAADLEMPRDDFDLTHDGAATTILDDLNLDRVGIDESTTNGDLTPVMDPTDELTSPMVADETGSLGDTATQSFTAEALAALRPLRVVEAVPVETIGDAIEIDAEGKGKTRLPFDRIEALAMAAVDGLDERTVLVIDFALNWSAASSEPLKLIRLRSDRFDPQRFVQGAAGPLEALQQWVQGIAARTGAACRPDAGLLEGRFERYEDLSAYDRAVWSGCTED